ncbi:hypothetical protein Taro_013876 [Colocasia esculenta]|uniref:Mitochondrial outer membrane protein porin 6 n=1 Tax=Colocasia esculenta TaxID=4460 RepID=A0A843UDA5_COLES|nr:hypothetical protein [Colocasia esculenta]
MGNGPAPFSEIGKSARVDRESLPVPGSLLYVPHFLHCKPSDHLIVQLLRNVSVEEKCPIRNLLLSLDEFSIIWRFLPAHAPPWRFHSARNVVRCTEENQEFNYLLTKDYNFDHECVFTVSGDAGLAVAATGVKINQLFIGDLSTQYRRGSTSVDVKVDTNSNMITFLKISTTVTLNEVAPGVKTALTFKIPDHKSGKLDVEYLHHHAAINSTIGLTPTPSLEFAAAIGSRELNVGAEIGFDTASASFTKYNAGIGLNKDDFSASLILADKGETLKASYIHNVDPNKGTAVAAEMINRLNTYENTFTLGSSHSLTPFTSLKTRFSSNGKLAVLCSQEWRPNSRVTLSAEYDPKSVGAPSRVGVALALKP